MKRSLFFVARLLLALIILFVEWVGLLIISLSGNSFETTSNLLRAEIWLLKRDLLFIPVLFLPALIIFPKTSKVKLLLIISLIGILIYVFDISYVMFQWNRLEKVTEGLSNKSYYHTLGGVDSFPSQSVLLDMKQEDIDKTKSLLDSRLKSQKSNLFSPEIIYDVDQHSSTSKERFKGQVFIAR